MSRTENCIACRNQRLGVKTRVAMTHSCGLENENEANCFAYYVHEDEGNYDDFIKTFRVDGKQISFRKMVVCGIYQMIIETWINGKNEFEIVNYKGDAEYLDRHFRQVDEYSARVGMQRFKEKFGLK